MSTKKTEIIKDVNLYFEKNNGHMDDEIGYVFRSKYSNILLQEGKITLCLLENNNIKNEIKKDEESLYKKTIKKLSQIFKPSKYDNEQEVKENILNTININFLNYNKDYKVIEKEKLESSISYIKSNDENNWVSNIEAFKKIVYQDIYKSIDLVYYEKNKSLAYDLIVKDGSNINDIKFNVEGASNLNINKDGDLEITKSNSKVIIKKPIVYQIIDNEKVLVDVNYSLDKYRVSLKTSNYNKKSDLIIQNFIQPNEYLDINMHQKYNSIISDDEGNIYITGTTVAIDFPLKNPISIKNTSCNIYISKINKYGNLVFSTYLGGSGKDESKDIQIDKDNNIYITGITTSNDFPLKNSLYNYTNKVDSFVCKIQMSKNQHTSEQIGELVFSTYIGGGEDDYSNSIYVDENNDIYITGSTRSKDFPMINSLTNTIGDEDIFITKIQLDIDNNPSMIFSTTLGGNKGVGNSIHVDNMKNIYVGGYVMTPDFPLINEINGFNADKAAYIIKLNMNDISNEIKFATYLNANRYEVVNTIKSDELENIYVSGYMIDEFTSNKHIFVCKINNQNEVSFYKEIAGSKEEIPTDMDLDIHNNIYITGYTTSEDFILKDELFSHNQKKDAYLMKMNSDGEILFSTCLGGTNEDVSTSISVNKHQQVFISGYTLSKEFRSLVDDYFNYEEIFITKIELDQYIKIEELNITTIINKDSITEQSARELTTYVNTYKVTDFYVEENIKKASIKLDDICSGLIGFVPYKEIYIEVGIDFEIALFENNNCLEGLRIYAIEKDRAINKAHFSCTSLNDKTPKLEDFEVVIDASYKLEDLNDKYYGFNISAKVGLLYRGDL